MRLEDWPIDFDDSGAYCAYTDDSGAGCLGAIGASSLGALIASTVEHAKSYQRTAVYTFSVVEEWKPDGRS